MRAAETFGRFGPGWLSRRTEVLSHRENGCQRYPELMESKGISLEFRYALDGIGLSESFRRKWIIRHVTWALEAEELAKEVVANPGEIPRWTRMAFWIRLYGVLWDLHEDWKADRARILALQSDENRRTRQAGEAVLEQLAANADVLDRLRATLTEDEVIFCQFRRLAEAHPESNVIGKSVQKPKQGLAELQEKELEKSPLSRRPRIREVWSALKRMEKKFECDYRRGPGNRREGPAVLG